MAQSLDTESDVLMTMSLDTESDVLMALSLDTESDGSESRYRVWWLRV